jgi:hypothetical protein
MKSSVLLLLCLAGCQRVEDWKQCIPSVCPTERKAPYSKIVGGGTVHIVPASDHLPHGYCMAIQKPDRAHGALHLCPSAYCEVVCAD